MSNVTPLRLEEHMDALINYEAERALLGAIMVSENSAFGGVSDFLKSEHFADPIHGRIYEACSKLIRQGKIADPRTLKLHFDQDEALKDIGGAKYLARLVDEAVMVTSASEYGRVIQDAWLRRQVIAFAEDMIRDANKAEVDETAADLIERAQGLLSGFGDDGRQGGFVALGRAVALAMESERKAHTGAPQGARTGISDLDWLLGPMGPGDLIYLAGQASMGKSALALNIALNVARSSPTGFFSLEMNKEQLAVRLQAQVAGVDCKKLRLGELDEESFQRAMQASHQLDDIPLYIDERVGSTIGQVRVRANELKRQFPELGLIVVDYLQLLTSDSRRGRENRTQEVSDISRHLKAMAMELEIPVLAISQLSRRVEDRTNKRPFLADLRESGALEQDADVVMFVFREGYYLERDKPQRTGTETDKYLQRKARWEERCTTAKNTCEIIIAKARQGKTGTAKVYFDLDTQRFGDLEKGNG